MRGRRWMSSISVDEALIDADPATIYAAVGDLARGKAQWRPGVEIRPRGEISPDLVGGVVDMVVRRLPGGTSTLRFVEVSEKRDGPQRIHRRFRSRPARRTRRPPAGRPPHRQGGSRKS